jgi:integrase
VRPAWFLEELRRRAERLGLPVIDVHGLRHSYATAALKAGVSVHVLASRIGHADPATTLRVYSHVFRKDDHEAAALAAGAILGRGEHSGSIPAGEQGS